MNISNEIRTGRHCVFNMHVHLVFVTKYRHKVFDESMLIFLQKIFAELCCDFEAELIECQGESDHVHLLIHYPPKLAVSKLVNSLKGVSSRLLKANFKSIHHYYWKGALWSPSYFAGSCGGATIDIIRKYIEQQQKPSAD